MSRSMTMIPISSIPGAPIPAPAPRPVVTAATPDNSPQRQEWKRVFQRHGADAIPLLASGYGEDDIGALLALPAALRERFAACKVDLLCGVQAADVFGASLARWMSLAKQGALIAPETMTPSPRWARSSLIGWAANGCRWGGVGNEQPELLGRGVAAL